MPTQCPHYFHFFKEWKAYSTPAASLLTPRASLRIHAPHTPALTQSNSLFLSCSLALFLSHTLALSLLSLSLSLSLSRARALSPCDVLSPSCSADTSSFFRFLTALTKMMIAASILTNSLLLLPSLSSPSLPQHTNLICAKKISGVLSAR